MDKSDKTIGLIFGELYASHPVAVQMNPGEFLEAVIDKDDAGGAFDFSEYFFATIDWLHANGYVQKTVDFNGLNSRRVDLVLTEKGLLAMRKLPDSLGGTASIGERLASFAKDKSSIAVGAGINELVSIAFGA